MNVARLVFGTERDEKGHLYVKNGAGHVTAWLEAHRRRRQLVRGDGSSVGSGHVLRAGGKVDV